MSGNDRVVLVTGASSGIGEAIAVRLSKKGYRVYGTSRAIIPGTFKESEGFPVMISMDVTSDDSVNKGIEQVYRREGRLDAVINNAGFGMAGAVEETTVDEAKAQFETVFFGTHRVCRAVLPFMRRHGGGYIINISSLAGLLAIPFQGFYSASKFAVEGLTEALSMELRPFGIRVVLIEPGDTRTGFTANRRAARAAAEENSPYRDNFKRSVGIMEKDELAGLSPEAVARLVEKVLATRRPLLRYIIAPLPQRSAVVLKKILPSRIFESVLMRYYQVR